MFFQFLKGKKMKCSPQAYYLTLACLFARSKTKLDLTTANGTLSLEIYFVHYYLNQEIHKV
jgi:hypothetical protein